MQLSIVVPMYDEARGLDEFFARTEEASREVGGDYEIVCVNDGSRDDTLARLLERRRRDPRIKVVNLSRNFISSRWGCWGNTWAGFFTR